MVTAHPVVALEIADHRLDSGARPYLAADGFGDTTDLTTDPDLEAIGIVVAAIALVAVDAVDQQPGHQSRRQRRLPWPDATDRPEASGQKISVSLRRQTDQVKRSVSAAAIIFRPFDESN
jgi:hypothetical protein